MSNQRTAPILIDLARSQLLASFDAIAATQTVSLDDACGRVAAETIASLIEEQLFLIKQHYFFCNQA